MKNVILPLLLISFQVGYGQKKEWRSLFNGKDLAGWDTFLGSPAGNKGQKLGLNNDTIGVFTIANNTIHVSGEAFGIMAFEEEFENFHVKVDFKWGEKKWPPRLSLPRDAGLLYFGFGPLGGVENWIASQECQIQEGDAGDYWPIGAVTIDIPSVKTDTSKFWVYRPGAPLQTKFFSKEMAERRVLKYPDNENPHGTWNTAEVIAWGDSSVHIINGKVVMRLYHSRRIIDGQKVPLKRGKIALQSEGAELFYKNVLIKSLKSKPKILKTKS